MDIEIKYKNLSVHTDLCRFCILIYYIKPGKTFKGSKLSFTIYTVLF